MASQARPFCSRCHRYGHMQAACPAGKSFRPSTTNTKTKDGHTICLRFNHSSCPNANKCQYAHVCLKCEVGHPASAAWCLRAHHLISTTPVDVSQLESELNSHPDKAWTSQVLKNLTQGARVSTSSRVVRFAPTLPPHANILQSSTASSVKSAPKVGSPVHTCLIHSSALVLA